MTTVNLQIAATADDCGSYNSTNFGNSDIYIGTINGTDVCRIALRFLTVAIPQGATITSAVLQLRLRAGNAAQNTLTTIYGNDVDDAVSPTTRAGLYALDLTTASLNQTWVYGGAAAWHSSSSFSAVIQEIVDRASWSENNALQLIVASNSSLYYCRVTDYTSLSTNSAKLDIEYTAGGGASAVPTIMNSYRQRRA